MMNLLDLHDDVLISVLEQVPYGHLKPFSALSRRLRQLAAPILWERAYIHLGTTCGARRPMGAHGSVDLMKSLLSEANGTGNLRYVRKLCFGWSGSHGGKKRGHCSCCLDDRGDDGPDSMPERSKPFFDLLTRIVAGAPALNRFRFHNIDGVVQLSPSLEPHFMPLLRALFSKPTLRSLAIEHLPSIAHFIETEINVGVGSPTLRSSAITHLEVISPWLRPIDVRLDIIHRFENLSCLKIAIQAPNLTFGFAHWCTDEFWGRIRELKFGYFTPLDWEDMLRTVRDFKSRKGSLRLETLELPEDFADTIEGPHFDHVIVTAEAFACDSLKELCLGSLTHGWDWDEQSRRLRSLGRHFPNLETLQLDVGLDPWTNRKGVELAENLSSHRKLRRLEMYGAYQLDVPLAAYGNSNCKPATAFAKESGIYDIYMRCPQLETFLHGFLKQHCQWSIIEDGRSSGRLGGEIRSNGLASQDDGKLPSEVSLQVCQGDGIELEVSRAPDDSQPARWASDFWF